MATTTDDNAAYEKSDKSIWRLLNIRCTRLFTGHYTEIEATKTGCLLLGIIGDHLQKRAFFTENYGRKSWRT